MGTCKGTADVDACARDTQCVCECVLACECVQYVCVLGECAKKYTRVCVSVDSTSVSMWVSV